jgi:hypothetical protein
MLLDTSNHNATGNERFLKLPELYGIVEPSFTWRIYLMRKAASLPQITNKNYHCVAKDCFGLPPI